jgi:hypothetical protein
VSYQWKNQPHGLKKQSEVKTAIVDIEGDDKTNEKLPINQKRNQQGIKATKWI